ncbi:MAG TPA: hypothetical protein VJS44_00765 [Pyrinomonadaceae bacterium]|nr:hypothetical protein [Pyrinomonadaceae bacterium]
MNPLNRKSTSLWFLGTVVLVSGFTISFFTARHAANIRQQEQQSVTSKATLPKLISKVKKLEIVNATIQREGEPNAAVTIEVKNNSDLAVTYFALTNGTVATNEYGVASNGLEDPDNPRVVIAPHSTATINILLSNLDGRYPIFLSAAVFADNSEDGDESVLKHMRAVRARDKAKRDEEKEKAKQKGGEGVNP